MRLNDQVRLQAVASAQAPKATIFDLAAAAKVSITTVSHVFSGNRPVNAETRKRVLAAAERLAYAPNTRARALATGRSYSLALQVSFTGEALLLNTFFAELLPAISLAAVERGYSFVYVPPAADAHKFIAPLVGSRRIDGAVFVDPVIGDPFLEAVRASDVPFASIARPLDSSSGNWVDNDHAHVCEVVAAHLAKGGYQRAALLTIEGDGSYLADYLTGYQKAFAWQRVLVADQFTFRAATEAAVQALRSSNPPEAFFCIHDQFAAAVESAVEAEGLRVGKDVGIIGVGDSMLARQARTPLSSVNVFPHRHGAEVVAMLDELISGAQPAAPVLIPARLVARGSTRRK
jgi:DNA-binding LacI/PurR family transcriptional regulator